MQKTLSFMDSDRSCPTSSFLLLSWLCSATLLSFFFCSRSDSFLLKFCTLLIHGLSLLNYFLSSVLLKIMFNRKNLYFYILAMYMTQSKHKNSYRTSRLLSCAVVGDSGWWERKQAHTDSHHGWVLSQSEFHPTGKCDTGLSMRVRWQTLETLRGIHCFFCLVWVQ